MKQLFLGVLLMTLFAEIGSADTGDYGRCDDWAE
jgi:hypothetical protein